MFSRLNDFDYYQQEWITSGSKNLYRATNKNAYVKSVDILIPANWKLTKDIEKSEDYAFTVRFIPFSDNIMSK